MRNNSLALVTVIALCINGVGAGLVPLPAAASAPDRNPATLGALPAWFAAMPGDRYPAAGRETSTDDAGPYRLEGLSWGTQDATLDPATLPPSLRPTEAESAPVLWVNPGMAQTSSPLSTGVRFTAANGRGGGTRHRYFVPFNDVNLWTLFDDKDTGLPGGQQCHVSGVPVGGTLSSSIFVIASSDRTRYYYDHWEDGYDADPLDPEQRSSTTEVGVLDAGAFVVFQDAINSGQVGTVFFHDGRDLITIVGEQAAVVRQVYPSTPGTVLAAAWEIPEVDDWGTAYVATVGEDLADRPQDDHRFAGLEVMAALTGTEVYYNGVLSATLGAGETLFVNGANNGAGGGGVDSRDTITANGPIQVQMMTGSCSARYSAHGYTLQPVDVWDTAYWAPVPGFDPDDPGCDAPSGDADTDVYLHNPHSDAIVVTMSSSASAYDIPIPAGATVSVLDETGLDDISTGGISGTQLYSSQPFWGVAVIDSATTGDSEGRNFDWGYSLVAESKLSSHVIVGYAPGSAPPLSRHTVPTATWPSSPRSPTRCSTSICTRTACPIPST